MAGEASEQPIQQIEQKSRFSKLREVLKRKKKEAPKTETAQENVNKASSETAEKRAEKEQTAERIEEVRESLAEEAKGEKPEVSEKDKILIEEVSKDSKTKLARLVKPGLGITPTEEGMYSGLFGRDFAKAAEDHYADADSPALITSLGTILRYQIQDGDSKGALPARVEDEYLPLKVLPGLEKLAKPLFNLIEKRIRGRQERPVFAGKTWYAEVDAVPSIVIAADKLFSKGGEGEEFVRQHYQELQDAMGFVDRKLVKKEDLLIDCPKNGPDWQNSINRKGELGGVNILYARALKAMAEMAGKLGKEADAGKYQDQYDKVRNAILEKIYNKEEHYFKASADDPRLDTVASIQGARYLLDDVEEAAKVEQTITDRVRHKSGLVNFDVPYKRGKLKLFHRVQCPKLHNEASWMEVTAQNIHLEAKIGEEHPDLATREKYKKQAVLDFVDQNNLVRENGGAWQVFEPDTRKPYRTTLYHTPNNFLGSMAALEGARYRLQQELKWI